MSQLFLSHSSKDNTAALALHDWLISEGWDDLFLDLDPERGIVAGESWERALHQAANRCDAVLFLVSKNWLASEWCQREFDLAHRLNKRIFGLLIEDIAIDELPTRLTDTWQLVNLAGGQDHKRFDVTHPHTGKEGYVYFSKAGLKSLRNGLQRAGLDPKFFDWPPSHDPERPPYRGLRPLEADDAGIFFGREAPTIELIARLRGLRERGAPRLLAILGASGAGKSSFLRAGLLPRLAREDRHFIPLPVLRPESTALTGERGLVATLVEALKDLKLARAAIREAIETPDQIAEWLMQAVRSHAREPDGPFDRLPTLILSIDQAEELFFGEGREESDQLLHLIQNLAVRDDLPLIVIFTIRSDSYDALQHAKALEGMPQETFSLVPMPRGAYSEVILGPAKRLKDTNRKLEIEPALGEALLDDLKGGGTDALPLLAFTLERLYLEYGDSGALTKTQYRDDLEGISGSIKAATEEVFKKAQTNPALPNDRSALEALARRALIPWLTGIDLKTRVPRRRVARMRDIPAETGPLVEEMIDQRLLTTNRNKGKEVTVEPAHEALLRQWGLLKGWLKEDLGALATLEGIQRATRDWLANNEAEEWLNHTAGRLEEAETTAAGDDAHRFLEREDHEYLRECRKVYDARAKKELEDARALAAAQKKAAEEQRRVAEEQKRVAEQKQQVIKRTRIGLAIACVLLITTGFFGFVALESEKAAQRARLEQSAFLVEGQLDSDPMGALSDAFKTFNRSNKEFGSTSTAVRLAMKRALESARELTVLYEGNLPILDAAWSDSGQIQLFDGANIHRFEESTGWAEPIVLPIDAAGSYSTYGRTSGDASVLVLGDDWLLYKLNPNDHAFKTLELDAPNCEGSEESGNDTDISAIGRLAASRWLVGVIDLSQERRCLAIWAEDGILKATTALDARNLHGRLMLFPHPKDDVLALIGTNAMELFEFREESQASKLARFEHAGIRSFAWSQEGDGFAVGTDSGLAIRYNFEAVDESSQVDVAEVARNKVGESAITAVALLNRSWLAIGQENGEVAAYQNGFSSARFRNGSRHRDPITKLAFNFTDQHRFLLSASGREDLMSMGRQDNSVRIWDISNPFLIFESLITDQDQSTLGRYLSIAPDGRSFAVNPHEGEIAILNQAGDVMLNVPRRGVEPWWWLSFPPGNGQLGMDAMTFLTESSLLVIPWNEEAFIWDGGVDRRLASIPMDMTKHGVQLASIGDGKAVIIGSAGGRLLHRSTMDGNIVELTQAHREGILNLSVDGDVWGAIDVAGNVSVWRNDMLLSQFSAGVVGASLLSLSSFNEHVVTAGADGKLTWWSFDGVRINQSVWMAREITAMASGADLVFAADAAGNIHVFSSRGDRLGGPLSLHNARIQALKFFPESRSLLSIDTAGFVIRTDWNTKQWASRICERLHRAATWSDIDPTQVESCMKRADDSTVMAADDVLRIVWARDTDGLRRYLESGNSPDRSDKIGRTGVMLAAQTRQSEMVSMLIDAGADVHKVDQSGRNLLHYAVWGGMEAIISTAINSGLETATRDPDGRTALDLAHELNDGHRLNTLMKNGIGQFQVPDAQLESQHYTPTPYRGSKVDGGNAVRRALQLLEGDGIEQSLEDGVRILEEETEAGNPHAKLELARAYSFGAGVQRDPVRATQMYQDLAAVDHADAHSALGFHYLYGEGIYRDTRRALESFQRASALGSVTGISNLALMYSDGLGVPQNKRRALELYMFAAENGSHSAERQVARLYSRSGSALYDPAEAFRWMRAAAEGGDRWAKYELGMYYELGFGIKRDRQKAIEWLEKAADEQVDSAIQALKRHSLIESR